MKIEIISNDAQTKFHEHLANKAWLLSRPSEDPYSIDSNMVRSLDLPVNEMPSVVLFIESTIVIREIITTMRNHVMWAQTSRVQNILEFDYPDWADKDEMEKAREKMISASENSRQDDYRMLLPIVSNTKYTVRLSARDVCRLVLYFEKLEKEYPYLEVMFQRAKVEMCIVAESIGYTIHEIIKYKTPNILRQIEGMGQGMIGDTVVVGSIIPFSLRAQLVRHRNITIQDNLSDLMGDYSFINYNLNTPIVVKITGLKDDIIDIYKKRSCWIAQYNLWSPLLNKIDKVLMLREKGLPCSNGECPYNKDAELRYTNKDPNAPCPIHAKINSIAVTENNLCAMEKQVTDDMRPDFWRSKISETQVVKFQD